VSNCVAVDSRTWGDKENAELSKNGEAKIKKSQSLFFAVLGIKKKEF
jgi:hypothetical protein